MFLIRRMYLFLLFSVTGLLLSGCGGGGDIGPVDISNTVVAGTVRGRVQLDSPLVGATVVLKSRDGQTLRGTATTDQEGRYEIVTDDARHGLQVQASGGSTQQGAFTGTVSTYLEPFVPQYDVNLSPVTTLANRYRNLGGKTIEQAQRRMALYLNLTPGRSIYADFSHGKDFNSATFMRKAHGLNFDNFVDSLVNEALASEAAQHSFAPLLTGWEEDLASKMAMDLARKAAQWAGKASGPGGDVVVEFAAGQLLNLVFGGKNDSALDAVFSKLDNISRQLDTLTASINDIQRELYELKVLQRVAVTEPAINNIKTVLTYLKRIKDLKGEPGIEERKRLESMILSSLGDDKIMIISNMLNGELGYGTETPIMTYGNYLLSGKYFWSQADANKMRDFIEFYDTLNIQMYYLVMEAENAKSIRETGLYSYRLPLLLKELEEARSKYTKFIPKNLPTEDVFIDIKTSRMWTGPYTSTRGQYASAGNFVADNLKAVYPEWNLAKWDKDHKLESFMSGGQGLVRRGFPEKLITQKIGQNPRVAGSMSLISPRAHNRAYFGCEQYYKDYFINNIFYEDEWHTCHYINLITGVKQDSGRVWINRNPGGRDADFYLYATIPTEDMKAYIPWMAPKK